MNLNQNQLNIIEKEQNSVQINQQETKKKSKWIKANET